MLAKAFLHGEKLPMVRTVLLDRENLGRTYSSVRNPLLLELTHSHAKSFNPFMRLVPMESKHLLKAPLRYTVTMAAGCQHELWKVLSVILIYIPSDSDHKVCRLLIAQVAYIVTLGNRSESAPLEPPDCVGSRDFSKGGSKSSFRREWTYGVEK